MDAKSLRMLLASALVEAKELHHVAVSIGVEVDENWPKFYADVLARKLVPVTTGMQAGCYGTWCREVPVAHVKGTMTVDGHALPPFYTRSAQEEIGSSFTSRYHTGE